MAVIPDYQMKEIERKAGLGERMQIDTPDKIAAYNSFANPNNNPYAPKPAQPAFDPAAYAKQFQDQINNMYNQQREAELSRIRASRDQAIGSINQQKGELAPAYADKRNQADVVSSQNVQKLRELMAANGLTGSGENVTSQVALGSARQGALSQLNLQEQQQRNDYDRRIADLNNPAEENALIAALEAERSRSLLDMGMRADEIGYSRGRDGLMDSRYADETAYNRGRDTIGDNRYQEQFNYQAGRDQIGDNRYNQQFDYQQQRDQVGDNRYQQQFNYQQQRDQVGDNQWQQQFNRSGQQHAQEMAWRQYSYNNMSASEKARMDQAASQFGEEMAWRMYSLEYQGELDKSISSAQLGVYGNGNISIGGGQGGGQELTKMIK